MRRATVTIRACSSPRPAGLRRGHRRRTRVRPRLTVISGETGAGKSLLVDALNLLSGLRADSGVVRHGSDRAEWSAGFDLSDAAAARTWLLIENELDDADGASCAAPSARRGSRAWINGRPATASQLGELNSLLVEIHGQHEHQALLSKTSQLALLDAYGRHETLLAAVRDAAGGWSALLRERDLLNKAGDASERSDWLAHQLDELQHESLQPDAIAELDVQHRRHAHAAGLIAACDEALSRLASDDTPALSRQLQQLRTGLERMREHEPRLGDIDAMLDAAAIQLDEATRQLQRVRDDLDLDPAQFDALERRLGRIHDLARKHRVAPGQLAAQQAQLADELEQLRHAGARLAQLDGEIAPATADWQRASGVLGKARRKAAQKLATATTALIGELGMGGGRFEIALEAVDGARPDPQGGERVEFLVSANAGQPPRPLRKVASGGELSRISLAIEVAALGLDAVPSMVFDEVDSGIGGAIAQIVGQKLRALGEKRQVLCVTHLPQVAAQGHAHYRVSKTSGDEVTVSSVQQLDPGERQEELARMLGGVKLTPEARAAARRLLSDAG